MKEGNNVSWNGVDEVLSEPASTAAVAQSKDNLDDVIEPAISLRGRIGLVGLGGQGAHVVLETANYPIFDYIELAALNTDIKDNSRVHKKCKRARIFNIGKDDYEICGTGAGGYPAVAASCFKKSEDEVRNFMSEWRHSLQMKVVFVAVGLGGGTGTGIVVPFLKICRELGFDAVFLLATVPSLSVEGSWKVERAYNALHEAEKHCEGVMLVNNEFIYNQIKADEAETKIFKEINRRLVKVLAAYIEVMSISSDVNLDLSDLIAPFKPEKGRRPVDGSLEGCEFLFAKGLLKRPDSTRQVEVEKQPSENPQEKEEKPKVAKLFSIGIGLASGENRIDDAMSSAMDSYYLVNHGSLSGASHLLYFYFTPFDGDKPLLSSEVKSLTDRAKQKAGRELQFSGGGGEADDISWYADEFKDDAMMLILMSSGFDFTPSEAYVHDLEETQREIDEKKQKARSAEKNVTLETVAIVELPDLPNEQKKKGLSDAARERKDVPTLTMPTNSDSTLYADTELDGGSSVAPKKEEQKMGHQSEIQKSLEES